MRPNNLNTNTRTILLTSRPSNQQTIKTIFGRSFSQKILLQQHKQNVTERTKSRYKKKEKCLN